MNHSVVLLLLILAPASIALAADNVATRPRGVIYLNGVADLEKLRTTNPNHYARAEKIIAAADELCKPGPLAVEPAHFEAKAVSCVQGLLKTSNPPKQELGFRLDGTRYVALITAGGTAPRRVPIH